VKFSTRMRASSVHLPPILLQKRLVSLLGIGVARLLPIAFLVEFLHAGLGLSGEFAARIFSDELLIESAVFRRSVFPVALWRLQPEMPSSSAKQRPMTALL